MLVGVLECPPAAAAAASQVLAFLLLAPRLHFGFLIHPHPPPPPAPHLQIPPQTHTPNMQPNFHDIRIEEDFCGSVEEGVEEGVIGGVEGGNWGRGGGGGGGEVWGHWGWWWCRGAEEHGKKKVPSDAVEH
mmetsp:Transcript_604/g.2155  ORF Transcript_604/g.2155 Transcript_604/m.2155 type:complete len:131 (+) Transcript_604:1546-1938(+)